MRSVQVTPDESGTPDHVNGKVRLDNTSIPEIDFSYFFNENFAAELILGTTTHNVYAHGTSAGNLDLGNVTLLPPTLTAQYHKQFGKVKPYVGAGINYTFFYDVNPGEQHNVTYSNNLGYALQIGTDYQIAENVYLNFDIKKIYLSTDVNVDVNGTGTTDTVNVKINPLLIGLGIGYRF